MSAIAGLWRFDGRPDSAADCGRMLDAQRMYGPHDGRTWDGGALAMGRRLFRTLPEDVHDRQPLHAHDGRLTLVADVRLDNRDDLAGQLALTTRRQARCATRQSCWPASNGGEKGRLIAWWATLPSLCSMRVPNR